jgi:hypothetical protein
MLPSQPKASDRNKEASLATWPETVDLDLARGAIRMPDEEWIKKLEDGRKVKFIYQELPKGGAFITAQVAGNEVVYSIILTKITNPLSHEEVESHFQGELSKK